MLSLLSIGGFCGGIGLTLFALAIQRRSPRLRSLARGLLVSYITILVLLGVGEAYFRFVFTESNNICNYACQRWYERFVTPTMNAQGFRDREWTQTDWQNRTTVLMLGDSFTLGTGIENTVDRFGDVLAAQIGEHYAVINLGVVGTTPRDQLEILQNYPLQTPDVIILQYYLNDIEDAALSIGLHPGLNPSEGVPPLANESALFNFLYWRIAPNVRTELRDSNRYWSWLYSMYDHSVVWEAHQRELEAIIDYAERAEAELYIVIFPNMVSPFSSIPYVDRVAQVFEARGYGDQLLRLFDQAEQMPLNERLVSPYDHHAGEAFHRLVGNLLYRQFFAESE